MTGPGRFAPPAAAIAVATSVLLSGGPPQTARIAAGLLMILVWVVAAPLWRKGADRTEWAFVMLLAWGVFSAWWVGAHPLASKETLTVWLVAALLYGIVRRSEEIPRRWGTRILVGAAVVIGAAVLVEVLDRGLRVGGLLENPNVAASLLVPTVPVGWSLLAGRPRLRWAFTAVLVLAVVGTGSRAGLLALVVAIGLLIPGGRLRLAGIVSAAAGAVGVLVWRFVSQPDVLAWHRISIWRAVMEIWWERPMTGVGPGCLTEAATAHRILHADEIGHYQFVVGLAESTPLAVLVQLGAVGFVLAVLAVWFWWRSADAGGRRPTEVAASVAAMTVLALFHDLLTVEPVLWWWAILVGSSTRRPPDPQPLAGVRPRAALAFATLAVAWLTAWGILNPAVATRVWIAGEPSTSRVIRTLRIEPWMAAAPSVRIQRLLNAEQPWSWPVAAEALAWAEESVRLRPGLARGWAMLGRVHLRLLTDLGGTRADVMAAERALARACELDPMLPWNWLERARLARLAGRHASAVQWTRRAVEREPNTVRGWLFLARLELDRGNTGEARRALETVDEILGRWRGKHASDYDREILAEPRAEAAALRRQLGVEDRPAEGD